MSAHLCWSNLFHPSIPELCWHKLQEINVNENSCLIAACKTQALKTEVIEQRLLAVTYTGQSMPALKAVSQHLEAAENEAEAKLQQVSCLSEKPSLCLLVTESC